MYIIKDSKSKLNCHKEEDETDIKEDKVKMTMDLLLGALLIEKVLCLYMDSSTDSTWETDSEWDPVDEVLLVTNHSR